MNYRYHPTYKKEEIHVHNCKDQFWFINIHTQQSFKELTSEEALFSERAAPVPVDVSTGPEQTMVTPIPFW